MKVTICGPIKGICKQYAIWNEQGSSCVPVVFFQKPKWIKNEEAWIKFIRSMEIRLSADSISYLNEAMGNR